MNNHVIEAREVQPMFYELKAVLVILGISNSSLWRRIKDGTFPRPVKIIPNRTVWPRDLVDKFVADLTAEAEQNLAEIQ